MPFQELIIFTQDWSVQDTEMLVSYLDVIGFEGILEEEGRIHAYIQLESSGQNDLMSALDQAFPGRKLITEWNLVEPRNWNEIWESGFQPVTIASQCYIRASFHPPLPEVPYEIIIDPKMAFGTGHHETTSMMIQLILEADLKNKSVLDMGCGTGVLAILAAKRGATNILAIDNDEWACDNTISNIILNRTEEIRVLKGDASLLKNIKFDIIFANINRNILLNDLPVYNEVLHENGKLLLSGFHEADLPAIERKAVKMKLKPGGFITNNNWIAAVFVKPGLKE